jgi:Ca2+-transporting ATPase
VSLSVVLLIGVIYLPFLQPIFNTVALGAREWLVMLPLLVTPSVAAEVTKALIRASEARRTIPAPA